MGTPANTHPVTASPLSGNGQHELNAGYKKTAMCTFTSITTPKAPLRKTLLHCWKCWADKSDVIRFAFGNARKTMKCGLRSLLISMRDGNADISRVFHDAEAATISANDQNRFSMQL